METLSATLTDVSETRPRLHIEKLATSIEQHGLLVPPVVMVKDRQVVLLEGSRRVAASASLGRNTIDAFWVGSANEFGEWLEADREAQEAHPSAAAVPMSWTSLGIAYDRLLRLLPRGNFTTAYCAAKGVGRGDAQGAAFLVRTMRGHEDERVRRYARNLLHESEQGVRKPHAAVQHVRVFESAPGGPTARINAVEQAKIITNLGGQVAGLITALELLIPVHAELSKEAREAGGRTLADLGRAVTRVGRVLRAQDQEETS